jgi:maltose O-acetyltransferase
MDLERRYEAPLAPIIFEENAWLAAPVIVLRGATIGAHSVVGAGSVVTRNIPPRSVAVGLLARVVKSI